MSDDSPSHRQLRAPGSVGASPEVIEHVAKLHRRHCPSEGVIPTPCPCRRSIALCCGTCRLPIFVLCVPGVPKCLHALEVLDTSHPWWWGAAA